MESLFDINLYSRQISTYGKETMEKIIDLKILIIGLRGLGIEIAKNIILLGPKLVKIYDKNLCTINDQCANFYINDNDVGKKSREEACINKLQQLNPYVEVSFLKENEIFEIINDFNAIIITEIMEINFLFELNKRCRANKINFIYTASLGLTGFVFNDFGDEHIIINETGEEPSLFYIKNIIKDKNIIIIDNSNNQNFNLNTGSMVRFREIQGMNELNDGKIRKIKLLSSDSFSIDEDLSSFGEYIRGGIVEEIKIPKKIKFYSLEKRFNIPFDEKIPKCLDYSKKGNNQLLHCGIIALHQFYSKYQKLPNINDMDEGKEIIKIAKDIYNLCLENKYKWIEKIKLFDENFILKLAVWSRCEISPVCSFLGGIVSQEVVKITGKYIPINQWLWFDFFETLGNNLINDRRSINSRYDEQIAIFGQNIQNQLSKLNIFIIGAGALGCEFLKIFSLMGIATSPYSSNKVIVTDNDNIEISNLNRQFLFRKTDVGKSKSNIACKSVKQINEKFKCEDLQLLIGENSENIFDENFWESQDIIINAVDNIEARSYIDTQCTFYSKPYIDSGTLGTIASSNVFIPKKTISYREIYHEPEKNIPMCTLKKFPSLIEHCIEWGKTIFYEFFQEYITDIKILIKDKEKFLQILEKETDFYEKYAKMLKIKLLIEIIETDDINKLIEFPILIFNEEFIYNVNRLITEYPIDSNNSDGTLFWNGVHRFPHSISFNVDDHLILLFLNSFISIMRRIIGLKIEINNEMILKTSKEERILNNDYNLTKKELEEKFKKLKTDLELILMNNNNLFNKIEKCQPEIFEKDNDNNNHVSFIHSISNLRARVYGIPECNYLTTKTISGKIIPAIASTTAAITGIVALQIYTLMHTTDIKFFKCALFNFGTCVYDLSFPEELNYIENKEFNSISSINNSILKKFNIWDQIEVYGSLNCKQFIDEFKKNYNINIDFINSNSNCICEIFMMEDDDEDYKKLIEDLYNESHKNKLSSTRRYLPISISGTINDKLINIPIIKYFFGKQTIFIRNEEKLIKLKVNLFEKIKLTKKRYIKEINYEIGKIFFRKNCELLDEEKTLNYYFIKNEDIIDVFVNK